MLMTGRESKKEFVTEVKDLDHCSAKILTGSVSGRQISSFLPTAQVDTKLSYQSKRKARGKLVKQYGYHSVLSNLLSLETK